MERYCPNCGQKIINDSTAFCTNCGYQLPTVNDLQSNSFSSNQSSYQSPPSYQNDPYQPNSYQNNPYQNNSYQNNPYGGSSSQYYPGSPYGKNPYQGLEWYWTLLIILIPIVAIIPYFKYRTSRPNAARTALYLGIGIFLFSVLFSFLFGVPLI